MIVDHNRSQESSEEHAMEKFGAKDLHHRR